MAIKYKLLSLFTASLFFSISVFGQDQPLYNQFYFNPYLYNPAYVADQGVSELNLTYRKQWVNIPESPEIFAVNFQYATQGNVALGVSVQSEKTVLLNSNTNYLTFDYKVPLGKFQYLKFGLSAGVLHNRLDFDEITESGNTSLLNDPALINALNDTYYFSGQFGIQYKYKALSLGFSLPKLFKNNVNSTNDFNKVVFDELRQKIANASYRFSLSPNIDMESWILYRIINNNQDQMDFNSIFYYKDLVWAGAGYRMDYGLIGYFGINLLNSLKLSYSYEYPGVTSNKFLNPSHEIHLKLLLPRKKRANKTGRQIQLSQSAPVPENEFTTIRVKQPTIPEKQITIPEKQTVKQEVNEETTPVSIVSEQNSKPEATQEVIDISQSTASSRDVDLNVPAKEEEIVQSSVVGDLPRGHYVVTGVFNIEQNAYKHMLEINNSGYHADYFFNHGNGMYYVYIYFDSSLKNARIICNELRKLSIFNFNEAWVLSVEI